MATKSNKIEQHNTYNLTNSDGTKSSERYIFATNIKEAVKIAKEKYPSQFYFGKVIRCYNGGVRG